MPDRHVSLGDKVASLAGQDLRTPMQGGTQFPTDDSKQPAMDRLERSQRAAESGPMPAPKTRPIAPTLKEVSVKMPSTAGSIPQVGTNKIAQAIENDPLVQYLRKEGMQLTTNLDEMRRDQKDDELTSAPPQVTKEYSKRALEQQDDILDRMFGGYSQEPPKE